MQMAVWDVGLQWAQMFKNLWPKLSVQNRQGGWQQTSMLESCDAGNW